jgi:hypothetical protein
MPGLLGKPDGLLRVGGCGAGREHEPLRRSWAWGWHRRWVGIGVDRWAGGNPPETRNSIPVDSRTVARRGM